MSLLLTLPQDIRDKIKNIVISVNYVKEKLASTFSKDGYISVKMTKCIHSLDQTFWMCIVSETSTI